MEENKELDLVQEEYKIEQKIKQALDISLKEGSK